MIPIFFLFLHDDQVLRIVSHGLEGRGHGGQRADAPRNAAEEVRGQTHGRPPMTDLENDLLKRLRPYEIRMFNVVVIVYMSRSREPAELAESAFSGMEAMEVAISAISFVAHIPAILLLILGSVSNPPHGYWDESFY